jgi:IS30 family transposase
VFRRRAGRKKSMRNELIREYVNEKIREGWSPEQISSRLSIDHPGLSVSHETIYHYIYDEADYLVGYLAKRHKFRRKKKPYRREKKSKILNRISIDRRPEVINERVEFGHWESDSIVSSKSDVALNVLLERVSRKVKITRLINRKSATTAEAILERFRYLPSDTRKSITYDNGSENCRHEKISEILGIIAYFCNPYHSWEKGGVENVNGLIRRYVPKKMDLSKLTEKDIRYVENQLNNRPKKCLGYRTPNEVFNSFLPGGALEV